MSEPSVARRLHELLEPIHLVAYFAPDAEEALLALGMRGTWDAYFAGRAAPLGPTVPADVVHALFYNFAPGEVARHIPAVWDITTPAAALAAREQGCAAAVRRILGTLADAPEVSRAADLATRAATSAAIEGRPLYAGLRTLPVPDEPVARLWHAATLLREHRGDGHLAALLTEGVGGTESHVLLALSMGMPPAEFGRVHHLPSAQLGAVVDGLRDRGLIGSDGWLSQTGRQCRERVEATTDRLAAPAYDVLTSAELDQLVADLGPIAATVQATFPF